MNEGVHPGLRPVRGVGPSTEGLTLALGGRPLGGILQRRQGRPREDGACPWTHSKGWGPAGRRSVCVQALSTAHNHSCPPSTWQPLSSPGLRDSANNSQGRGTGWSYPQKSDLLPPWEWVGGGEGKVGVQSRQRSTTLP